MLKKEAKVSARDFAAVLFVAERFSGVRAGAAVPVAMVHPRKTGGKCESQNGAGILLKASVLLCTDEREKFVARLFVVPETAQHRAGYCLAVLFFHAAHLHAKVACF